MFWVVFGIVLVFVLMIVSVKDDVKEKNAKISNSEDTTVSYMNEIGFTSDADFSYNGLHVYVDDHHDKLMILDGMANKRFVFDFKSILGTEYQEDGVHTDGIGRAVVGGALFGETGAIVGAVTGKKAIQSAKIIIYLNDVVQPSFTITLHSGSKMNCGSIFYENMKAFKNRLDATIRAIISKTESTGRDGAHKMVVHDK